MKSMSKALLILAATALVGAFATSVEAATITLDNLAVTATGVTVDLAVHNLNEPTGGYGAQVAYNAADFTGASFIVDPNNKLGNVANPVMDFSGGFGFSPGILDLLVFSTATAADLAALQGPFPTTFVLAHIVFDRASNTAGTNLGLLNLSLSNADGSATIPLGDVRPVPEPATMLMLGTGLSALVMRRRKARNSQQ